MSDYDALFNIQGQTAVITGGGGILGSAMARALAHAGARVAVISLHDTSSANVVDTIRTDGGEALGIACDVTDRMSLEKAHEEIIKKYTSIDILINGAGGNQPLATTNPERSFFELDEQAVDTVFRLNFTGTFLSSQIFGQSMAERKSGCIVNVASMNAFRPLTRIPAYSAAKAAIVNFTQWLAVHMAQEYSAQIRVNAIAPGFFLTEQNRFLLTEAETGAMTARGQAILNHTPMGRFGVPADLIGTLLWLVSPASSFATGIVIPVDGGFSAFSGV
jgi:NAD(P)-dependent dehydrogenase (short-subunit alcohol dehydrogenase family)